MKTQVQESLWVTQHMCQAKDPWSDKYLLLCELTSQLDPAQEIVYSIQRTSATNTARCAYFKQFR